MPECVCGNPERPETMHRLDGPCWTDEEYWIRESYRSPEVLNVDGSKPDFRSVQVGDEVVVNGAKMYVSQITGSVAPDGKETRQIQLSALPPDFLADALYRFEQP